jgi:hypothetical protein
MAGWVVWNNTENRQEFTSVFPSQADADAFIVRSKGNRQRKDKAPDTLQSRQVS